MNILITGATGFVGRALVLRLLRDGHALTALVRDEQAARAALGAEVALRPYGDDEALRGAVSGQDAIINLAGEPIFPGRFTAARRRRLVASRVELTRRLVAAVRGAAARPRVLLSASAVGYYGYRRDEPTGEAAPRGQDFLGELCGAWEEAAAEAAALGLREARVRIGIVLGPEGGVLARLVPLFRAGLGGRIAGGDMWVPWIHLDDLVELFARALTDERYAGPLNAAAPEPVQNAALTAALSRALGRPALLPVPAFALKALYGEAAQLVLGGVRAVPARLRQLGFPFRHERLEGALADLLSDGDLRILPIREAPPEPYLLARRPTHLLSTSVVLDAPLDEVFAFFSRAENLGAITPPWMAFSIRTPLPIQMSEGALIEYGIRLGPVPMSWRTRILSWEPGARFVDGQEAGPYRSWFHEHRFRAEGARTVMEDRVYYAAPLGPLGRLANALSVSGMLRRIFRYRRQAIRLRFGEAPDGAAPARRVATAAAQGASDRESTVTAPPPG